ncbi:MAG TPA: hypothetical protein VFS11_05220 [Gemmatimonadales bacterium]|nr:hypothetical protein [Gemmatimonadales bacterium]
MPRCLDCSLSRASERGFYVAELAPAARPVPLGAPTTWLLRLLAAERLVPVAGVSVTVDGGMPLRGLRFPSPPVVSSRGGGDYQIAGLQFAFPGGWLLRLTIATPAQCDIVTFNLALE